MACCPWRSIGGKFTGSRPEGVLTPDAKPNRDSPNGALFVGPPAG